MITDAQLRMLRRLDHQGAAKELAAVKAGMNPLRQNHQLVLVGVRGVSEPVDQSV